MSIFASLEKLSLSSSIKKMNQQINNDITKMQNQCLDNQNCSHNELSQFKWKLVKFRSF
ncbi:hypothetical protein DFA_08948 [Cavenderia fasciculata]|uniref:Uncharacterized protein n=1 Tax=Cavenderia fasciculata TaxID=261658 RepID=F4Q554_CACFS|nr:uncharacterized protein DFA_08948 [Cavenderia fasciculata]EGG17947.1 hypothetical protein DFA_08948 [Cavenderia fasciculata]|eukprot:XP_004356431.1 hypothetical protein DFA_08948 [Cavenderia fasciculata]